MRNNNERVRFRYGICLNEACEKCKSKEVQEIPARKDFVCTNPECGKPLRECPPPKKGPNKKLIGGIIGGVAVIGIAAALFFSSGGEASLKSQPDTTAIEKAAVDSDSIKAAKIAEENQRLKDSLEAVQKAKEQEKIEGEGQGKKPVSKIKNLGYGDFYGSWPNDVKGRMVYKSSHLIDSRDPKGRVAEPGDYVIGEWSEGRLVQGIWYGADNQVKGSIMIGK